MILTVSQRIEAPQERVELALSGPDISKNAFRSGACGQIADSFRRSAVIISKAHRACRIGNRRQ
jgi:hypothetical protein